MSDFQLDKKQLLKDCPMIVKGLAGTVIDWLNNLDIDHDGKKDIAELAPVVIKAIPIIQALLPLIDTAKLADWLIGHDFITDKAAAEAALKKIAELMKGAKA